MKKNCFLLFFVLLFIGCKDDLVSPDEIPASLPDNYINAIFINDDGLKYFATKKGLASFDGNNWTVYHDNSKITTKTIHDLDFEETSSDTELWMGTNYGVNVATLPIDAVSTATTYSQSNTQILFPGDPGLINDSVFVVKVDDKHIRWFGTNTGISVFQGSKWRIINDDSYYNPGFWTDNQITSIDYKDDTTYIATKGGGVARMVSKSVDAITAASPFEIPWSQLPSNYVLSVFTDGSTQWFGTDEGLAKHAGTEAKKNWQSFYQQDGLISNVIQCINKDLVGRMWFGTPSGLTVFNGNQWQSYTKSDGLVGNNVICIAIDLDGSLWFGTDSGVSNFNGGIWTSYTTSK